MYQCILQKEEITCQFASLKCSYRTGCGNTLKSYLIECGDLINNKTNECSEGCKNTLVGLTSTPEGQSLMEVTQIIEMEPIGGSVQGTDPRLPFLNSASAPTTPAAKPSSSFRRVETLFSTRPGATPSSHAPRPGGSVSRTPSAERPWSFIICFAGTDGGNF